MIWGSHQELGVAQRGVEVVSDRERELSEMIARDKPLSEPLVQFIAEAPKNP